MGSQKGNGCIGWKVEVAFEKYSESMSTIPDYQLDIAIMDMRLGVGTVQDTLDDGKTRVATYAGSNTDHFGAHSGRRIQPASEVAISRLEKKE